MEILRNKTRDFEVKNSDKFSNAAIIVNTYLFNQSEDHSK